MRTRLRVAIALAALVASFGFAPAANAVPSPAATVLTTTLHGQLESGAAIFAVLNTPVHDSAKLSGTNAGGAGGTVTYGVYSDPGCSSFVQTAGTKNVSSGAVPDSDAVSLDGGIWFWRADYSGDPTNAATSSCNEVEISLIAIPGAFPFGDAHLWLGLRNSDDQGTRVDVGVQLFENDTLVGQGLRRCVSNLTRNPALAPDVLVPWDAGSGAFALPGDEFTLKISVRLGTKPDGSPCGGHAAATGVRLYFSGARPSRFPAIVSDQVGDLHLDADGGPCGHGPAASFFFAHFVLAPSTDPPECKDSGVITLAGGNPWAEIGTWEVPQD